MHVEDVLKNFEKFQKELGHGEFSGSPWNSPEAQHARLYDSRTKYFDKRSTAARRLATAIFFSAVALFIFFVFNGPPQSRGLVVGVATIIVGLHGIEHISGSHVK